MTFSLILFQIKNCLLPNKVSHTRITFITDYLFKKIKFYITDCTNKKINFNIINMLTRSIIFFSILSCTYFIGVNSLECYVCESQEDNSEKCIKTIKTCTNNETVCLTEIKWGTAPYWSQGAKKQYYISKRCSEKEECIIMRQRNMPLCTHIWYQDWVCSDCCQGDRCNYYIISGSGTTKPILGVLLGALLIIRSKLIV
ncbi:uncharacterized protein LOC125064777 [Vanessa atalanta]|uniref:uncharacterized protein LOC125064777 n=1 Tax=Vanessa atalanta TaxID=42275 RepID=UPI001FCCC135|nr:uncharacterized protein LOC125064777 [Vanessa atalanta]